MCGDGSVSWNFTRLSNSALAHTPANRVGGRDLHFPVWQFHKGKLLPGIEKVLRIFRSDEQWRVMLYFLANRHSLAMQRPLDLLRRGESDKVVSHATIHLEEHNW